MYALSKPLADLLNITPGEADFLISVVVLVFIIACGLYMLLRGWWEEGENKKPLEVQG